MVQNKINGLHSHKIARNHSKTRFLGSALQKGIFFFFRKDIYASNQWKRDLSPNLSTRKKPETPSTMWGCLGSEWSLQRSAGRQPSQHRKQSGDRLLHSPVQIPTCTPLASNFWVFNYYFKCCQMIFSTEKTTS